MNEQPGILSSLESETGDPRQTVCSHGFPPPSSVPGRQDLNWGTWDKVQEGPVDLCLGTNPLAEISLAVLDISIKDMENI